MKIRWMAGLVLAAATVLASAGAAHAHNDSQSGYFGSGHDPEAQAARGASPVA